VRAGEEKQPLRRWLADVRRFAGVGELTLGRLDRVATGDQLAGLLGRPPHQSLIDDVYARTQGNAYLTTLIVRDVSPDARSLPAGLPVGLGDAATRAWHGLSAPAQRLTQLIAIAGRPQQADKLGDVAAAAGVHRDVVPLLREAVDGKRLPGSSRGTAEGWPRPGRRRRQQHGRGTSSRSPAPRHGRATVWIAARRADK
jgi:hypothetical protein